MTPLIFVVSILFSIIPIVGLKYSCAPGLGAASLSAPAADVLPELCGARAHWFRVLGFRVLGFRVLGFLGFRV